jgi:hypothetical protein
LKESAAGQPQNAWAFYPQTALSDGHRAAVTTELGEIRDGSPVFEGAQNDDVVIDCDGGMWVTTRTAAPR